MPLDQRNSQLACAAQDRKGFTLVELLIGMTILAVALLFIASMFQTGYTDVAKAGQATMAATAAQQVLEDLRAVPYTTLVSLYTNNGSCTPAIGAPCAPYVFRTDSAASLPNPAIADGYSVLRRFRYSLAGPGGGFPALSNAERNSEKWTTLSTGTAQGGPDTAFGAVGTVTITDVSATLFPGRLLGIMQVTVAISYSGSPIGATLTTRISR